MRQFPKLRPCLWDGLVAALVVALAVGSGAAVWGQGASHASLTVVVSVDGAETERCPLDQFSDHRYTNHGYTLQVTAEEGGIRVLESDCPTQDCVHTGTITRAGESIVCLPARIVIQLEGDGEDGVDLVVG